MIQRAFLPLSLPPSLPPFLRLASRLIQFFLYGLHEAFSSRTGRPNSLQERGRDSRLRVVLCYKWLFTKVTCMGCKRSFLKVSLLRKAVYIPYKPLQITVCYTTPLASKSHVRVPVVSLGGLCLSPRGAGRVSWLHSLVTDKYYKSYFKVTALHQMQNLFSL